ncbi:zinc ribbon domain-containing protein YjdM [Geothermobacter hydrogeniphilus]|uniref:Alkylphosphonate utilization protein n=1 Tax=Geothermobacter hydrogeniphilus TaxID=1969733 RepID=A0A1X0XN11_9BACT|nr:zinc ribbon domain-containing protein YjdM [Geothermobacter hydrogeniphilus]ORJ54275.1 alkylphosphonate utilization protein [Geothermobacter hydrogeniphilus]
MSECPNCPECGSEYAYEDRGLFVCPECAHEWSAAAGGDEEQQKVWRDAHGNVLADGDTVTVIKDLKIKGSSAVVKVGTKVKNIRLVDGDHDIDCKIPGIGAMGLKSEFVKKG